MDVKQAVKIAKTYLGDILSDEEIVSPPTLEEVRFDEIEDEWRITLGVHRPHEAVEARNWHDPLGVRIPVRVPRHPPDYKVVRVADKDGKVVAIVNREPGGA